MPHSWFSSDAVAEQGFSRDRPLFRRDCALEAPTSSDSANGGFFSRLVNVHEGLESAGVSGGSVSLVSGQYEYYHYMQVRTFVRSTELVSIWRDCVLSAGARRFCTSR